MNREIQQPETERVEQPERSLGAESKKFDASDSQEIGNELAAEKLDVTERSSDVKDEAPEEKPVEDYPDLGESDYSAADYSETNYQSTVGHETVDDYPDNALDTFLKYNETNETTIDTSKIDSWDYRPSDTLYEKYQDVFDNPKYYDQKTGEIHWPPNNGVEGEKFNITLQPGDQIDRYGLDSGFYASPIETPYSQRSLAPGSEEQPYSQFEVIRPIDVEAGKVSPWFNEPGQGIQYKMPDSIEDLIGDGYLRRI